jgi:hypothetical protein
MPAQAIANSTPATQPRELQLGRIRVQIVNNELGTISGSIEEMSPTDVRVYCEDALPIGSLVTVRLSP